MVNSDNVFRGGLTDKYMDIPLLLNHLDFRPTTPIIIESFLENPKEKRFEIPSKDFELTAFELNKGEDFKLEPTKGPAILLCLKGSIRYLSDELYLNAGEAFFIPHDTPIHFKQVGEEIAVLFKAGVPK
jgi:mannose-6-phosphate isomerase